MGGYLERLKKKKRPPQALPKLPKGENISTHGTATTAKSPFDSKDSKEGGHIFENWQSKLNPVPLQDHPEPEPELATARHSIKPAVQAEKHSKVKKNHTGPGLFPTTTRMLCPICGYMEQSLGAGRLDRRSERRTYRGSPGQTV